MKATMGRKATQVEDTAQIELNADMLDALRQMLAITTNETVEEFVGILLHDIVADEPDNGLLLGLMERRTATTSRNLAAIAKAYVAKRKGGAEQ